MSQYPKTALRRPAGNITLPLHVVTEQIRNALGEPTQIHTLYTDVEIGGQSERFIFDTGCSHGSFVSQEFADRHGIRIICDSILVSGAAASAYARAGILDSMRIGPVTVYNPTFIISPPNEAVDTLMKVHAVLGTDFMNLAGEVRLYPQQGKIVLPAEQTPLPACGRNLSLDTSSGQYALSVSCDTEPVTMIFDTGSTGSSMSRPWFESHRAQVEATGTYKEMGWVVSVVQSADMDTRCPRFDLESGHIQRRFPIFGFIATLTYRATATTVVWAQISFFRSTKR